MGRGTGRGGDVVWGVVGRVNRIWSDEEVERMSSRLDEGTGREEGGMMMMRRLGGEQPMGDREVGIWNEEETGRVMGERWGGWSESRGNGGPIGSGSGGCEDGEGLRGIDRWEGRNQTGDEHEREEGEMDGMGGGSEGD